MTLGRHPNVLIGLLLAAVAVFVVVAVAGLGGPAAAAPTPPPVMMVSEGPMPPEGLPVFADCGRYPDAVFATAGADPTGWHPFHVFGLGNVPTTAERWLDEVPRHVSERLQAA